MTPARVRPGLVLPASAEPYQLGPGTRDSAVYTALGVKHVFLGEVIATLPAQQRDNATADLRRQAKRSTVLPLVSPASKRRCTSAPRLQGRRWVARGAAGRRPVSVSAQDR